MDRIGRQREAEPRELGLEAHLRLDPRVPVSDRIDVVLGAQDHERRRELGVLLDKPV